MISNLGSADHVNHVGSPDVHHFSSLNETNYPGLFVDASHFDSLNGLNHLVYFEMNHFGSLEVNHVGSLEMDHFKNFVLLDKTKNHFELFYYT